MSEIFYQTETAVIRRLNVLNIERPVNDFGAEDFGPPNTFRVNAAGKEYKWEMKIKIIIIIIMMGEKKTIR